MRGGRVVRVVRVPVFVFAPVFVFVLVLVFEGRARAQDAFEIQVYDAEIAEPGESGVEVHLNYHGDLFRATLEPHVGLARWMELGGYLQTAFDGDGVHFAGTKLRAKLRWPQRLGRVVGLALNFELSMVPTKYEATGLGGELRPIVDVAAGRFYASVNPIVGFDWYGAVAGHPQFEPAATVLVRLVKTWQLGAEYYAAFGAVDQILPASRQAHRLFAVTQVAHKWFAAHLGVGYGLAAGDKWIVKSILTFDFE